MKSALPPDAAQLALFSFTPSRCHPSPRPLARPQDVAYRSPLGATWTGRGQRPVWVQEALRMGLTLDDLRA